LEVWHLTSIYAKMIYHFITEFLILGDPFANSPCLGNIFPTLNSVLSASIIISVILIVPDYSYWCA